MYTIDISQSMIQKIAEEELAVIKAAAKYRYPRSTKSVVKAMKDLGDSIRRIAQKPRRPDNLKVRNRSMSAITGTLDFMTRNDWI